MNEAETRAELIDPALAAAGWGVVEGSRIRREYPITLGRLEGAGKRGKALTADYVLEYRNTKLAVVEAKAWDKLLTEGVGQAKDYAGKLAIRFSYATNGQGIYGIDMHTGTEGALPAFPTPDTLWQATFAVANAWRDRFAAVPFEDKGGFFQGRYYQDIAVERALAAIAEGKDRILLTMATGTGKTFIASQLAWKLFHSRWNLGDWKSGDWKHGSEPTRRPRILFLADRNILADQAYNAFSAFPEDALVRIAPDDIRKKGKVPKNGSLFFTIFQTFMSGPPKDGHPSPWFGEYPPDFFDFIVIDECHRGGANDESNWRGILEYFAPAVQLGLTATTLDEIDQKEKTLVFCATQDHALAVRDLINQIKNSADPNYCQRVTANDGALGEQWLRDFQDNEKTIPTILTTSQKLSTGVDARNVRNIVLMRPVNSMIEFKQIIGRGTRLFDGKDYFTVHDFVKAHHHFGDPAWDGEPIEPEACKRCGCYPCTCDKPSRQACPACGNRPCTCTREPCPKCGNRPCTCRKTVSVELADGKARQIQHMSATTFWHPDGTPMSAAQFAKALFGELPDFFKDEDELRTLWSAPGTRRKLLEGLAEKGFGRDQLAEMQRLIAAEKSDLFDVLAYIAYAEAPLTREEGAMRAKAGIGSNFSYKQQTFLSFVLAHYVSVGVEELDEDKLGPLLKLKYHNAIADAFADLGPPDLVRETFVGFQRYLYQG